MNTFPAPNMNIFRRSVLVSLFFHLFICTFFIFKSPMQKIMEKPQLFFLGSILYKQDILMATSEDISPSKMVAGELINTSPSTVLRYPSTMVDKPLAGRSLTPKRTTKSTFAEVPTPQAPLEAKSADAMTEPPISYKPLRLNAP